MKVDKGHARVQVTMDRRVLFALDQICERTGETRSGAIEELVSSWIKRHEKQFMHEGLLDRSLTTIGEHFGWERPSNGAK